MVNDNTVIVLDNDVFVNFRRGFLAVEQLMKDCDIEIEARCEFPNNIYCTQFSVYEKASILMINIFLIYFLF